MGIDVDGNQNALLGGQNVQMTQGLKVVAEGWWVGEKGSKGAVMCVPQGLYRTWLGRGMGGLSLEHSDKERSCRGLVDDGG